VALYFLLRQFFSPLPSLSGTLVYGVHSAHTLSVYWISAAPEPMAAACYVISLLCFIRFDRTGRPRLYALSLVAAILGTMSKESILSLPLVIAAYCLIFPRKRWKWGAVYFALPTVYVVCRLMSTAGASPYPLVFGKETLRNLFAYLAWMAGFSETLLKLKLNWQLEHNYPWIAAGFVLAIAGMIRLSKNRRVGFFATVWFVLALQPVLYFSQHIFAYYLAPALLAWSLLIAGAISTMMHTRWAVGAGAAAAIICYSGWAAEASVKREGKWWTERSFISRDILKQMPEVARQVPPGHIAFLFGFGPEEFGAMQWDAAFKAYGFPPAQFILFGLDERTVYDIETLRSAGSLGSYYCFLYSHGVISNRTFQFRAEPRVFYSPPRPYEVSPRQFLSNPKVRIVSNLSELVAGKDTLRIQIFNLKAPSIDVLYELNGRLLPPGLDWRLDGNYAATVPVDKSTPRGEYHWIGIRDSSTRSSDRWIAVDIRITVR
jgi:hypothetical protein